MKFKGSIQTALILAQAFSSFWTAQARAAELNLAMADLSPNSTYLSNTKLSAVRKFDLLDPAGAPALKQQFEDMNRDYELRKASGLVTPELEQAHTGQISGFSQGLVGQIENFQKDKELKPYKEFAERKFSDVRAVANDEFEKIKKSPVKYPLGAAGLAYAVYTGQPAQFSVTPWASVAGWSKLQDQSGSFQLSTPWARGTMDIAATVPFTFDKSRDPMSQGEHYRFNLVSSLVPMWHLNTGFTYGSTSNTVKASLSKEVMPHLTASLDSIQPIAVDATDVRAPEETFQLKYGINF